MKLPTRRFSSNEFDQTSMTPLIDVVFQLLIFFICASTGHLREALLPANLGAGQQGVSTKAPESPVGRIWIQLTWENEQAVILVEQQRFTDWEVLNKQLQVIAQAAPEIPVIFKIQPNVPMQQVITLYDLCRGAGFQSLHFSASKS